MRTPPASRPPFIIGTVQFFDLPWEPALDVYTLATIQETDKFESATDLDAGSSQNPQGTSTY